MLGFKLPLTLLELLSLVFDLLTLSGTILGHEGPEVIKVEQDSDVVLPCSLSNKQDITAAVFDWKKVAHKDQRQKEVFFYDAGIHYNNGRPGQSEQFRGRVSHFQDQLKHGDASIIIRNTKMADSGHYTCAFPRLQPRQTFYIELVVDPVLKDRSAENIPGVAPKPSVTSLDETKDRSLLQCEAHGNPQPEVEWQDSHGDKLPAEEPTFSERGGSFYVTLNITVTQTDDYRCVATQETFSHQIHAETFVYIHEKVFEDSSTEDSSTNGIIGWLALGFVLGGFVVLAVPALLVYKKRIIRRLNNAHHKEMKDLREEMQPRREESHYKEMEVMGRDGTSSRRMSF